MSLQQNLSPKAVYFVFLVCVLISCGYHAVQFLCIYQHKIFTSSRSPFFRPGPWWSESRGSASGSILAFGFGSKRIPPLGWMVYFSFYQTGAFWIAFFWTTATAIFKISWLHFVLLSYDLQKSWGFHFHFSGFGEKKHEKQRFFALQKQDEVSRMGWTGIFFRLNMFFGPHRVRPTKPSTTFSRRFESLKTWPSSAIQCWHHQRCGSQAAIPTYLLWGCFLLIIL